MGGCLHACARVRVRVCAEWRCALLKLNGRLPYFLTTVTTGESQFQRRKPALVITLGSMGSPSSAAVRLARVLAIQRFLHCKQLLLNNLGSLACLHHYDKSSKLRARVSILSRTQSATHSRKRTLVGCFVPPIYAWGGGGPPPISILSGSPRKNKTNVDVRGRGGRQCCRRTRQTSLE